MVAIPVPSDTPYDAPTQTTFWDDQQAQKRRIEVLEKTSRYALVSASEDFVISKINASLLTGTVVHDFGSITNATVVQTGNITVVGAAVGDSVAVGCTPVLETGLIATGVVTAANTVVVRVANLSGGAVDPASHTWRATVFKISA